MKIIVLAGGYSNERDVSLNSGAGICRALRDRGHQAYLLDAFLGLPDAPDQLDEVFDLPDGGLSIASDIRVTEPDLDALWSSRPGRTCWGSALWLILHLWRCMEVLERTANYRPPSMFWVSAIRALTPLAALCLWIRASPKRYLSRERFRLLPEPIYKKKTKMYL